MWPGACRPREQSSIKMLEGFSRWIGCSSFRTTPRASSWQSGKAHAQKSGESVHSITTSCAQINKREKRSHNVNWLKAWWAQEVALVTQMEPGLRNGRPRGRLLPCGGEDKAVGKMPWEWMLLFVGGGHQEQPSSPPCQEKTQIQSLEEILWDPKKTAVWTRRKKGKWNPNGQSQHFKGGWQEFYSKKL